MCCSPDLGVWIKTYWCGVVRSCGLCLNSLALYWARGISMRGTTPQGVTFYGLSAERAATSEWVISQFNGTSTPKGSYSAKTGDTIQSLQSKNCTVWEHVLSGQVWTKCPTRPDTQGVPQGGCSHAPRKVGRDSQNIIVSVARLYGGKHLGQKRIDTVKECIKMS